MLIRSTYNGGLAEVSDEEGAELILTQNWVDASEPVKPKRIRRTKAQIAADKAAEEAAKSQE